MAHVNTTPTPSDTPADTTVSVFFSEDYVAAAYDFPTTRKSGAIAESVVTHPIAGVALVAPEPAARADLERVHEPAYIDAILTGEPRTLAASAGLSWDPGFVTALLASTGGCIAAADAAWSSGIAGSLSSGLHHAAPDRGQGFCSLNGLALAALTFLDLGARSVQIVDLDAHCGGGTQDILGSNPLVTQVDVSTNSYDGRRPIDGWTSDLVDDAGEYLPTIIGRLDAIDPDSVGAVLYNAGMDPHEDCATGGLRGITDAVLAERDRIVFDWAATHGLPIAFVLAGGYTGSRLTDEHLTALHRLTIDAAAHAHLTHRSAHRSRGGHLTEEAHR